MISLSPLYFLGLGVLCTRGTRELWSSLFVWLSAGLLLNHLLLLVLGNLSLVLGMGAVLSLGGLALIAWRRPRWPRPTAFSIAFFVVAGGLYFWRGLFDPIFGYDPISLWFLQSKQIFISGALRFDLVGRPQLPNLHLDYPKLVPGLAAELCHLAGYWNDALAKVSFANLLLAAIAGLASFARPRAGFALLVFGLLIFAGEVLWGSFLDGYLALYAGVGSLFWARALQSADTGDEMAGLLAFGIAVNLKNEGLVLLLTACLAMLVWRRRGLRHCLAPALLILATFGTWSLRRYAWGLPSDLSFGSKAWLRLGERAGRAETYQLLWSYLVLAPRLPRVLLITLGALAIGKAWRERACRFTLLFAALYFGSLLFVYLSTPHDLDWHLRTSAFRTILAPIALLFATASLALGAKSAAR